MSMKHLRKCLQLPWAYPYFNPVFAALSFLPPRPPLSSCGLCSFLVGVISQSDCCGLLKNRFTFVTYLTAPSKVQGTQQLLNRHFLQTHSCIPMGPECGPCRITGIEHLRRKDMATLQQYCHGNDLKYSFNYVQVELKAIWLIVTYSSVS